MRKAGGNVCAAMNGANEAAVGLFLEDKIAFPDIYRLVKSAVDRVRFVQSPDLEEILDRRPAGPAGGPGIYVMWRRL